VAIRSFVVSGAAIVQSAGRTALIAALTLTSTSAFAQLRSTIGSKELVAMDPLALARLVDESRPTPVSAAARAQVLAALPTEGVVRDLDDGERRKLAGLAPVLEAAERGSVYAIMVIDVPHAFVGFHERTVVLISRPALRVMSADELRGALAHEAAHEYVQEEYKRAQAEDRRSRLQDLELVCDILAVMTLRAIGHEARSLPAAIEKLQRFNWFHFGYEVDPDYPDIMLRRSIVLSVEKKIARIAARR
jgi:hypothetical protein